MNNDLSDIQKEFVRYLVRERCSASKAAENAGYAHPRQRGYELLRKPNIARAIRAEQQALLNGDLTSIAFDTLKDVMQNPKSPASAKVAASRAVLEAAGFFKKTDEDTPLLEKDPLNMTTEELERFVIESRSKLGLLSEVKGHG